MRQIGTGVFLVHRVHCSMPVSQTIQSSPLCSRGTSIHYKNNWE